MKKRVNSAGVALVLLLTALPAGAVEWEATTAELLKKAKPGYGGLSGVAVEPRTGDVYVSVSDRGVYRSTDRGRSWKRLGEPFKGRTEWPGALAIDPVGKGKRVAVATVYGAPIALGTTAGGDWKFLHERSAHVDWCALDWAAPRATFILALKHESGGLLIASRDGGKTFRDVSKGYGPAWVFDGRTAVVAQMKTRERPKPGLVRTTDGGKTFTPCGSFHAQALPKWRGDTLYWLTEEALIASKDKGASWKKLGALKGGRYGPIFGKDARHFFVLTNTGIVESRDGGATWGKPLALPKELKGVGPLSWMEYDPVHDVLYAMKMGSQLFKLERKPKK
jgi:photosystem II stability/assembly factor-like uncharacterized protein